MPPPMVGHPIAKPAHEVIIKSGSGYAKTPTNIPSVFLSGDEGGLSIQDDLFLKTLKQHDDQIKAEAEAADKARLAALGAEAVVDTYIAPEPVKVAVKADTDGNTYPYGWCTWYAAAHSNAPNYLGNANLWDDNARDLGYTVTTVPRVGAVAQTDAYGWGHVAVVEDILEDKVKIGEMNWQGFGDIDHRWVGVNEYRYIYF